MNPFSKSLFLKTILVFSLFINVIWMYKSYNVAVESRNTRHSNITNEYQRVNVGIKQVIVNNLESMVESIRKIKGRTCPAPNKLVGALKIDFALINDSYDDLSNDILLQNNGSNPVFEPGNCDATVTVAIIIPFRGRELHLRYLLGHLHPVLKRQLIRYQIFVVEQVGNYTFNKGRLMNTGFEYARSQYGIHFDCFIFHDVDMLPENDNNIYTCDKGTSIVRHLSCSVNKFQYKPLCCGMTVGGVVSFTEEQYDKVNGFPNHYWGWGGEDDDMNARIKKKGLTVKRPPFGVCRYFMIGHERDDLNPYTNTKVNELVKAAKVTSDQSGLNNLNTTVVFIRVKPLYVHLFVNVGKFDDVIVT